MPQDQLLSVLHAGLGALLNIVVPLFLVSLVALGAAVLQTAVAIREESMQYSVRVVVCTAVLAVLGSSFLLALQGVMEAALR